jgi:hypothetical protein
LTLALAACERSEPEQPAAVASAPEPSVETRLVLPSAPLHLTPRDIDQLAYETALLLGSAPPGSAIYFMTHDALDTGMSGPGLVCNVGQAPAQATVVHCYPADAVHAAIEFRACRDWLARQGQTAISVSHDDERVLRMRNRNNQDCAVFLRTNGLFAVIGAGDLFHARELIAQLFAE